MLAKSIIAVYLSPEYHTLDSKEHRNKAINPADYSSLYLTAVRLLKHKATPVEYIADWPVACFSCLRAYNRTKEVPYGKLYINCPKCAITVPSRSLDYYRLLHVLLGRYYTAFEIDYLIADTIDSRLWQTRASDLIGRPISLMERLARLKTKA